MNTAQVVRNAGFLVAAKIIGYLFPLLTLPVLTRSLGPTYYGELQYIHSLIAIFFLFTEYGSSVTATRAVAKVRGAELQTAEIFSRVVFLRLFLCTVAYFAMFVFCTLQGFSAHRFLLVSVSFLMPIGEALNPSWLYIGQENTKILATSSLIARAIALPLIVLFVRSGSDLGFAVFFTTLPWLIGGVISFVRSAKYFCFLQVLRNLHWLWVDLRLGFSAAVSNVSSNVGQSIAAVILGTVAPRESVATFGVTLILITAAKQVLFPISQVMYAHSSFLDSNNVAQNPGSRKLKMLFAIGILGLLCSLCLFVGAVFAIPIIFGNKYGSAVELVKVVSAVPFVFIVSQTTAFEYLYSKHLDYLVSRAMIVGNVVCVVLSFLICHKLQEFGAALSVLVGEVFSAVFVIFFALSTKNVSLKSVQTH